MKNYLGFSVCCNKIPLKVESKNCNMVVFFPLKHRINYVQLKGHGHVSLFNLLLFFSYFQPLKKPSVCLLYFNAMFDTLHTKTFCAIALQQHNFV